MVRSEHLHARTMTEPSEESRLNHDSVNRGRPRLNWRRGILVFWFILTAQFIWRSAWGFVSEGFSWYFVGFAVLAAVCLLIGLRLARRQRADSVR